MIWARYGNKSAWFQHFSHLALVTGVTSVFLRGDVKEMSRARAMRTVGGVGLWFVVWLWPSMTAAVFSAANDDRTDAR